MKTAKQEAIEKAYTELGVDWEHNMLNVDEKAFIRHSSLPSFDFDITKWDVIRHKNWRDNKWRPKSLRGIETNNFWIRIESEEDLPKEEGEYNIITIKGQHIGTANFTGTDISKQIWLNAYTHFRVIENIKRPIY